MVRNSSREGWLMEGQRAFNHQLRRRLWTIGKHTDTNMRQTGPTLSHSRTRCSFHSDQWPHGRFFCLIWFATLLIVFGKATGHKHKGGFPCNIPFGSSASWMVEWVQIPPNACHCLLKIDLLGCVLWAMQLEHHNHDVHMESSDVKKWIFLTSSWKSFASCSTNTECWLLVNQPSLWSSVTHFELPCGTTCYLCEGFDA
jgi:hypothetical protein